MQLSFGNFCLIDYEVTPHSQWLVLIIKYRDQIILCIVKDQIIYIGCMVTPGALLEAAAATWWTLMQFCEYHHVAVRSSLYRSDPVVGAYKKKVISHGLHWQGISSVTTHIALSIAIIYSLLMLHLWVVMWRPLTGRSLLLLSMDTVTNCINIIKLFHIGCI